MKKTNGITLVALIITVIVMLILVAVTVRVVINSNLIETAQNAADATETAYSAESNMSQVTIGGTEYNSIEEYQTQKTCNHEWGEWEVNTSTFSQKRACTKCNKIETTDMIKGATIVGYDPSVGASGTISTSYSSVGAKTGGTETTDGTSGNGYGKQTFTVGSITKWRIFGNENGQIQIVPADSIRTNTESFFYLRGQAGYANSAEELNKISGLYGQGKYADTSKYSYTINGKTLASGGRSVKLEDLGTKTWLESSIAQSGFIYWGEDASPSQGAEWKTLEPGQSVKLKSNIISITDSGKAKAAGTNSSGEAENSWMAFKGAGNFNSGFVYYIYRLYNGTSNIVNMSNSNGKASSGVAGVRPVVTLISGLQLKFDSETGEYTIIEDET